MHRLARNSAALSGSMVLAQASTGASYWIVARQLSPSEFGPLVGAVGLAMLLGTIADFGVNAWTVRALAQDPSNVSAFTRTLTAKLLLALLLGLVWTLVTVVGAVWAHDLGTYALLGAYISVLIMAGTVTVPFRAAERMNVVAVASVVEKVSALAFTAALLLLVDAGQMSLVVGLTVGAIASLVIPLTLLNKRYKKPERPSFRGLWQLWKSSLGFGITGLTTQIQKADVAIVGLIAGPAAAGAFAAPARLTGPLGVLPNAYSTALFPRVAAARDRQRARREALLGAAIMMTVMILLLGTVFALSARLVNVVLGSEYVSSASVLRIYVIGMTAASLNQPMAVFLQAEGKESTVARTVGFGSLFGLAVVSAGAAVAGAQGAAFGFVAVQAFIFVVLAARCCRSIAEPLAPRVPSVSTAYADS